MSRLSGQGAFGDRGCGCSGVLGLVLTVVAVLAVAAVPFVGMACQTVDQPGTEEVGRYALLDELDAAERGAS